MSLKYRVKCNDCDFDMDEFKTRQAARRYARGHAREMGHNVSLLSMTLVKAAKKRVLSPPSLDENVVLYCNTCRRILYSTDAPDLASVAKQKAHERYTGHDVELKMVLPNGELDD